MQDANISGKNPFDVFLCHNSKDKPEVKKIAEQLKQAGIVPWLDEWELQPGLPWQRLLEQQLGEIKSAAVFVGKDGVGPWQQMELEAYLREFVARGCPVIPVILADAPEKPQLPVFLRGMTWVDFRKQISYPMDQLIWGITGKKPSLSHPSDDNSQNVNSQAHDSISPFSQSAVEIFPIILPPISDMKFSVSLSSSIGSVLIQDGAETIFHFELPSGQNTSAGWSVRFTYLRKTQPRELDELLTVIPKLLEIQVDEDAQPTYINMLNGLFEWIEKEKQELEEQHSSENDLVLAT